MNPNQKPPAEVHRQLPSVPDDVGANEDGGGAGGLNRGQSEEGLEMGPLGGGGGMGSDEARISERRESVRLWESPEFQTGLGDMAERGRPMGGRERTHRIRNVSDDSVWGIEPGEFREIMGAEHETGGTDERARVGPKIRLGERGAEGFGRHDQEEMDRLIRQGDFVLEPTD